MKIKQVMKRRPYTVLPDDSLAVAREIMVWAGVRHLPVVQDGRVVGILSARDVAAAHARADEGDRRGLRTPVERVMTTPVQTAGPDDSISEAAGRMALSRIGCLPVTERGDLIGLVTATDILEAQVTQAMQPSGEPAPAAEPGITVGDVMTPDPARVHPDDHLLDAAGRMVSLNVRHLPVVDADDRVIGMLSDRDVRAAIGDPTRVRRLHGTEVLLEELRVQDAMSAPPITTTADRPCAEVAGEFARLAASAVPVVDDDGKLLGILSYVDLLRAFASQ